MTTVYIFTALQVSNLLGLCLQPTNITVRTALRTIVAVLGHMLHILGYGLQLFVCLRSTQLTRVDGSLVYVCQVIWLNCSESLKISHIIAADLFTLEISVQ